MIEYATAKCPDRARFADQDLGGSVPAAAVLTAVELRGGRGPGPEDRVRGLGQPPLPPETH